MISFAGFASIAGLVARFAPLIKLAKWLPITGPLGAAVVPVAVAVGEAVAAVISILVEGVTKILAHPATLSVLAIAVIYGWTLGVSDEREKVKPLQAQLKQCREEVAALKKLRKPGVQAPTFKWGF